MIKILANIGQALVQGAETEVEKAQQITSDAARSAFEATLAKKDAEMNRLKLDLDESNIQLSLLLDNHNLKVACLQQRLLTNTSQFNAERERQSFNILHSLFRKTREVEVQKQEMVIKSRQLQDAKNENEWLVEDFNDCRQTLRGALESRLVEEQKVRGLQAKLLISNAIADVTSS